MLDQLGPPAAEMRSLASPPQRRPERRHELAVPRITAEHLDRQLAAILGVRLEQRHAGHLLGGVADVDDGEAQLGERGLGLGRSRVAARRAEQEVGERTGGHPHEDAGQRTQRRRHSEEDGRRGADADEHPAHPAERSGHVG